MSSIILRRLKLGRTSAAAIAAMSIQNLSVVRNDRLNVSQRQNVDWVIRWGCTSNIPDGVKVLNTAEAIHEVNDKLGFRIKLQEVGLCPDTWFLQTQVQETSYPVIVRPSRHAQGKKLHVCRNVQELRVACQPYLNTGYYISKLINKVAEYRVCVVQGRAVWVAKKTPGNPQDVAWNVARGGRFDNVRWEDWPLKAVKVSIEAFNLSKLDFGGVDVMVDADGKCYVLEINSAPSLTSPYRQKCITKAFDWIISRDNKARIPLITAKGGYKKFIHPAVCAEAIE